MDPKEMVAFLNGDADDAIRMRAAWEMFTSSGAFDAAATDAVMVEYGGASTRPVAFFEFGVVVFLGDDKRWAIDESGVYTASGIDARYDDARGRWSVSVGGHEAVLTSQVKRKSA